VYIHTTFRENRSTLKGNKHKQTAWRSYKLNYIFKEGNQAKN